MENIEGYKFGHTYKEPIAYEDADKFAKVFGEGSAALTELIKYCITNNIVTIASCKGHPEDKSVLGRITESGYITFHFDVDYANNDFAYYLASLPFKKKGITAYLESNFESDRTVTLYVPAKSYNMSEEYFSFILDSLRNYKSVKEAEQNVIINPSIKQITDYAFYSNNSSESFSITHLGYKKYERQGFYIKPIAKCPKNDRLGALYERLGYSLNQSERFENFVNSTSKLR